MKQSPKLRAITLFNENMYMINESQTQFRKKVMQTLMAEFNISQAASATHYNNAKKLAEKDGIIVGLGRGSDAVGDRRRSNPNDRLIHDDDCFTVLEVIDDAVTRTQSFIDEELARTKLKERLSAKIPTTWKLIRGLGPNVGDTYKLSESEKELA